MKKKTVTTIIMTALMAVLVACGPSDEKLSEAENARNILVQAKEAAYESYLDITDSSKKARLEELEKQVEEIEKVDFTKLNDKKIDELLPTITALTEEYQSLLKELGIEGEFANILHYKDGILTGQVGGEMMFNDSKGQMLKRLQILLDVTKKNTIAIGDGANDLSMFKYAGKRIAFCAKPIVKENADIIIEEKDLSKILDFIQ